MPAAWLLFALDYTRNRSTMARPWSLLLVLEDLHWATESTLGLLHYLTRHLTSRPALLAGKARPGNKTIVLMSGRNIDMEKHRKIINREI